jgi:hypothetical protein
MIERILYNLKRQYKMRVSLTYVNSSIRDYSTGVVNETRQSLTVDAVVLDSLAKRDFVQDLAYIAAGKNFTSGGRFDVEVTAILVNKNQVSTFNPMLTKYFVLNGKRYNVYRVTTIENSYLLKGEALEGERPGEVHTTIRTTIMTVNSS